MFETTKVVLHGVDALLKCAIETNILIHIRVLIYAMCRLAASNMPNNRPDHQWLDNRCYQRLSDRHWNWYLWKDVISYLFIRHFIVRLWIGVVAGWLVRLAWHRLSKLRWKTFILHFSILLNPISCCLLNCSLTTLCSLAFDSSGVLFLIDHRQLTLHFLPFIFNNN
jgi:hypothetical protein